MSSDALLLDRLLDVPRYQGAVSAVRTRTPEGWTHLSWHELQVAVRRAAGGVGARGDGVEWSAARGADQLVLDLAHQFAGVVGALTGGVPQRPAGADDPGRLVRMRQEVRPRDPAARVGGRVLDHGEVAARAASASKRLCPKPGALPDVILSTVDPATEQLLGWACAWGAHTLVCADAESVEVVDPTTWVCTPEQWRVSALSRSSNLDRLRGLGPRLRRVFVLGAVPSSPVAPPSVEVQPWTH